ncbi:hypothetical protein HDZ31DRAFT_79122 [Schizophyllum fasciatum]
MHDYDVDPLNLHPYSRTAATLGRVCKRWRALSLGYSALWTAVDVVYPDQEGTKTLRRCLRYSAGRPLTLWISNGLRLTARGQSYDPHFMPLITANAHRWVEISIELTDEHQFLRPLLSLPPASFSALRRARLKFWNVVSDVSTLDTHLWMSFFTSPRLDTADWVCNQFSRVGVGAAPLRQLTKIGMHFAEPYMLAPILHNCANLEFLFVSIVPVRYGVDHSGRPFVLAPACLPRLRVLSLCGPHDWSQVFEALTAPALDRLEMSRMEIPERDIQIMLDRSNARLTMLAVHRPRLGQAGKLRTLLQDPALQSLQIVRYERARWGDSALGWEEEFDLRPFVASHISFTASATVAEALYAKYASVIFPTLT